MRKQVFDWISDNLSLCKEQSDNLAKKCSCIGEVDFGYIKTLSFKIPFFEKCLDFREQSDDTFVAMLEKEMQTREERMTQILSGRMAIADVEEHARLQIEYTAIAGLLGFCKVSSRTHILYNDEFEILKTFEYEPSDEEIMRAAGIDSFDGGDKWSFFIDTSNYRLESVDISEGWAVIAIGCDDWYLMGAFEYEPSDEEIEELLGNTDDYCEWQAVRFYPY